MRLTSGRFEVSTRSGNLGPWSGTRYSFALTQGESLATGDFNGDHLSDIFIVAQKGPDAKDDPDYLVTQTLPLNFERRSMGVVNGAGDDVDVVDYNRDGSADFIVSNGDRRRPGPVQLWTNQVTTP